MIGDCRCWSLVASRCSWLVVGASVVGASVVGVLLVGASASLVGVLLVGASLGSRMLGHWASSLVAGHRRWLLDMIIGHWSLLLVMLQGSRCRQCSSSLVVVAADYHCY